MKTIHLLRHAKSDWSNPGLADHDRPLAPRGVRAATLMGRWMADHVPPPDAVICSTAQRAADTIDLVMREWPHSPPVTHDRDIYLCGAASLLARIRRADDAWASLMLVGHNPDLEDLAASLAAPGGGEALEALRRKFPTAAYARLTVPVDRWADVATGTAAVEAFVTPKSLG